MKKLLLIAFCFAWVLMAGNAMAIPFQIGTGGTLDATGFGLGDYDYDALASGPFDLAEEDTSSLLDFFNVTFLAGATGTVTATIDFMSPTPDSMVMDSGSFTAVGYVDYGPSAGYLNVTWADPVQVGYSYGGLSGGILQLDLNNINNTYGPFCNQGPAVVQGYITNVKDPVPEPATLLLLGSGIAGLAGMRFRRNK